MNRFVKQLRRRLESDPNFDYRTTGSGHFMVRNITTGQTVTVSASPSDERATKNIKQDLRKIGMEL